MLEILFTRLPLITAVAVAAVIFFNALRLKEFLFIVHKRDEFKI